VLWGIRVPGLAFLLIGYTCSAGNCCASER